MCTWGLTRSTTGFARGALQVGAAARSCLSVADTRRAVGVGVTANLMNRPQLNVAAFDIPVELLELIEDFRVRGARLGRWACRLGYCKVMETAAIVAATTVAMC